MPRCPVSSLDLPCRCLRGRRPALPSHLPACMSPPFHASPWTRQNMYSIFNQPLSLETSSVTDMSYMFQVRSARAPPPPSPVWTSPARCLRRRRPTPPSRLPARMSPASPCFPFDSAECASVQPAAVLRHVQRHRHELHVPGAFRPCPVRHLHSCPPGPGSLLPPPRPPPRPPAFRPACRRFPMLPFGLGRTLC